MVYIASSFSRNAGAVRSLFYLCLLPSRKTHWKVYFKKAQLNFSVRVGSESYLLFFFLGSMEESPEHRILSKQVKEGVCHSRSGWSQARACGLGPGAGIPHTDSESAAGDRSGGSTESHSVPCHQVMLTQHTHTAVENGIFERSVFFP